MKNKSAQGNSTIKQQPDEKKVHKESIHAAYGQMLVTKVEYEVRGSYGRGLIVGTGTLKNVHISFRLGFKSSTFS